MNMSQALRKVERALPALLQDDAGWKDVDVDYHPPRVERLWRDWEDWRIYLHRLHPCDPAQSLFHPHPWPSAMLLLSGEYEMGIGYGEGDVQPPISKRRVMKPGSRYAMDDINDWHYVAPIGEPVMSLMVTGKPWGRPSPKPSKQLLPLSTEARAEILAFFRDHYPLA